MSARDELIEVLRVALYGDGEFYREGDVIPNTMTVGDPKTEADELRDAVDALLSSGLCVLVDAEPAGYLIHEHYTDARTPFFVFHALPGDGVEPLYRRLLAPEVSP